MHRIGSSTVARRAFMVGAAGTAVLTLPGCSSIGGISMVDAVRRLLTLSTQNAFARLTAPGGFWDSAVARFDVPELFGKQRRITLEANGKRYVLERPQTVSDGLLVSGRTTTRGSITTVQLVAAPAATGFAATTADANARAPVTPVAPQALRKGAGWNVAVAADQVLWKDGKAVTASNGVARISDDGLQHCLSLTRREGRLESLHSPMVCVGPEQRLKGGQRWQFTSAKAGHVRLRLQYANPNGPINTGVTAAVKQLALQCAGQPLQRHTVALPHSVAVQDSTAATFAVPKGPCTVTLEEGFNMSALEHFAHYTGGKGGRDGVLNQAQVLALKVVQVAVEEGAR